MQPTTPQTPQNSYVSKMREQYPNNANLDDVTLAKIVRAKHYPDMQEGDFFTRIGLEDTTNTAGKKDVAFEPFVKVEEAEPTQKAQNAHVVKMREKYPMYAEIDDFTLAKAVKEHDYADMDEKEFFSKVGLEREFEDNAEFAKAQKQARIADNRPTVNTGIDFIDNNLVNDFTLGSAKNFLDYGASAVKGVGKIGGALGFDEFEQKAQAAQEKLNKASQRADKSIDNEYVALAGEMIGDPINLAPAGIFTQGAKAARVAKSMAGGAVVGGATMAAKNYGDDTMTQDEKNAEMGIGAGFAAALNGIIAGVTKGRVTSAINDVPDLEAMRKNPEAFGVTPEEAEQVAVAAQEHLKTTKQPKVSEELGISTPVSELDQIDNGFKALADEIIPDKADEIVPHGMNPEPKEATLEQVVPKPELSKEQQLLNAEAEYKNSLRIAEFKKSIDQPMEASVFETQAQNYMDEAQRLRDEIAQEGADGVPTQAQKPIIEEPSIKEPEPETVVKDGLTTPTAEVKIGDEMAEPQSQLSLEQFQQHPRFEELLGMRQDVAAKDIQSPQTLVSKRDVRQSNNGKGWEVDVTPATYERNYNADFTLTKQDVKNIRAGKIDESIAAKLETDLGTLDNHPDYKATNSEAKPAHMSDEDWAEANTLFAKGTDNLAAGTIAGIEQDENGNVSFDAEKFVLGLGGYTAVKAALKNQTVQGKLKEYAQKAVDDLEETMAQQAGGGTPPNLKDIPWDKLSKKEASKMVRLLQAIPNNEGVFKNNTVIKTNEGDVKVTDLFAQKQVEKHLDNPDLRGMATTQEVASFPKVGKNVDATQERQGLTWRAATNDNKEIVYGSGNFDEAEQLKTVHTKTERGERGQLHQEINDRNFHNSDKEIVPQNAQTSDELFIPSSKFSTTKDTIEKSYRPLKQTIAIDGGDKIVGVQKEAPNILVIRDKNGEYATIDKKLLGVKTSEDGVQTISYKGVSNENYTNILMANGTNSFGGGLGGGLIGGLEDTDGNYIPDSWNWRDASLGAMAGMGVGHFAKGEGTGMFGGKAFTTTYNKLKAGKLPNASALPDETLMQLSQRKLQDKFNRVKQLINTKADMSKIDDAMNPYQAEELMHGRVEAKIKELETQKVTPILEKISKAKLTTDQVDEYLWARHAPERNAKMLENYGKENGSGMSDAEAYTIINKYANNKAMQDIANDVYAMNRDRLKYIHSEGLESEEFIKMLDANYDNYVPLRREFENQENLPKTGKGFDIKGKETMRAKGSDRTVESPLMHSILAYEETIVRAEKNQVGKAFLEFTKEFPDESLYSVAAVKHLPQYDKSGAVVGMSPNYKTDDNVLHVKVDGKVQEITIHDPALASAFKNLNSQQMNSLLLASQKAVRTVASLSTSYNPEFVVTNFTRDIQTAMINMPDGMKANRSTILKDVFPAMQGIYASQRGGTKNEWSVLFEELKREGGTTGWHELHSVLDMKKTTQAMLDKYDGKIAPIQTFKEVLKYIDDVNSATENASRLVAYKMAKESGKTNKQAASIAKNLTVNFNKKGEWGAGLNAAYMFYNASLQGSARMVKQLATSKTSQALVGAMAGIGVALDTYNRSQNEDAYAALDDYIKDTNYIFMHKDGTYNSIKLPYGYNIFKATGDLASQMYHGDIEASKIPKRVFGMTVNAFSPIGVDAESAAHTLSPTVVKPFVEIDQNKNFFGGQIAPEKNPFEPDKPDSQNYFKSVNPLAKATAQKMNEWSGGNMYEKGGVDVSPESIEHLVEFATGGLGKLLLRTGVVVDQALDKNKTVDMNKVPFVRNFYGVPKEKAETNILYKMYEESGAKTFNNIERERFLKWTDAAVAKEDMTKEQAKKLRKGFFDSQRRLDFANKYNLQSKEQYQQNPELQDASREYRLTKTQRNELLKEEK